MTTNVLQTTLKFLLVLALAMPIGIVVADDDDDDDDEGQKFRVFCDNGQSIQDAVDRAREGAIIRVSGTCEDEAVVIQKDGIRIYTDSGATIKPPADSAAFTVRFADNVVISGFTIMGGQRGVGVENGASAHVEDNQILDSTSVGIFINGGSYGYIVDNVLDSTSGNFSQIFTTESSSADVIGNTITASSGTGISAVFASSVTAGGNNVSGTTAGGIDVQQNAHMFLPSENTVNNPAGQAVFCGFSGGLRVDVAQMTTGTVDLDPGCDLTVPMGVVPFP